jgi:3-oxoacyl-[acyl-carrier protein] reductase|tara:strand:- start:1733 stop:2488 length:756 start_codon:yes stop_codon:yes gene_type:complete
MTNENTDKTVIVTGGASGLGRYIVEYYLSQGAKVASFDLTPEPLAELALENANLLSLRCNITDNEELAQCFEAVESKWTFANVLINNAGIIHSEPLFSFLKPGNKRHNLEHWKKVLDINLTAAFCCAGYFAEQLAMQRKPGVIINISSVSAKGTAGQSAYGASKAGLNALTKIWANELGVLGIRVCSISPGYIDSDAMHAAVPKQIQQEIVNRTALRKLGTKSDVLQAIELVINNPFMTGNIVDVDGGYSC